MEGKIFGGVISSQMRFKKDFFPDKPLERRLDKFSPKTTPLKLRNEKMKS